MHITEINNHVLLFLLASIGLIALPHITHIPAPLFAFFILLLGWRFLAVWKKTWLPGNIWLFVITLTGIALIITQHQGILGRDAGTSLFITALGLKLLEIKKPRDIYLAIYLSFIVAATQFLYLQNIFMAAYIIAVSCVLLGTLICINSRTPKTFAALKAAAVIVLQAMPMMVIIFILFPRVESPRWLLFDKQQSAISGLSDSMEPGSISKLGMSPELVFRVKFSGPIPPPSQRYWRGPVLSFTDGKRWTRSKNLYFGKFLDRPKFFGTPYRYTLMMEPQTHDWVFALDLPADFSMPLRRNANYQLLTSERFDQRAEYKITSYPAYNTGYITKTEYRDNLQLPGKASAKINALVASLHGFDQPAEKFIQNLLRHFHQGGFFYTLFPPPMHDNPIEDFLFKYRAGFCGHYAAAFVYLMRVAGIPARVVNGYQGGEYNALGNFLEVRQANAHAWAEVWLQNRGWVRVDPTAAIAPERVEQNVNIAEQLATGEVSFSPDSANAGMLTAWLKQGKFLWNSVDYSWQHWVLNYNSRNQARFLSALGIDNIRDMMYWLVAFSGLLTALLAWLILPGRMQPEDRVQRIYNRFCKKLAKAALVRNAGEGPVDFARRASTAKPPLADSIAAITELYIKIRYGRSAHENDLQKLQKLVRALRV